MSSETQMHELSKDEVTLLDKYRRAKSQVNATLEVVMQVHIHGGMLVHINLTEKFRPQVVGGPVQLREGEHDKP